MNVAIIGAGNMGRTMAGLLSGAGHRVTVVDRPGSALPTEVAAKTGAVAASSPEDAVAGADLVVLAPIFGSFRELPSDLFDGQVVLDTMNYYPERDGDIAAIQEKRQSASQYVQTHFTKGRFVKAFNTLGFEDYASLGDPAAPERERKVIWVAGDDGQATAVVSDVIRDLGFAPVDVGGLSESGDFLARGSTVYGTIVTAGQASEYYDG